MHTQWKEICAVLRSTLARDQWPPYVPGHGEDARRQSGFVVVPRQDTSFSVYYRHVATAADLKLGGAAFTVLVRDKLTAYQHTITLRLSPVVKAEIKEPVVDDGYWRLDCVFPARVRVTTRAPEKTPV